MGLWDVKLSFYPYDSCSSAAYQPAWRVGDSVAIMQAPAVSWWPECEFKLLCQNSAFHLQTNLTYDIAYFYYEIKSRLTEVASVLDNQTGLSLPPR